MGRYINTERARLYVSDFVCKQMEKIPTSDVVEVIRCKDCKRSRAIIFDGFYYCKRHRAVRKADDFCSMGKQQKVKVKEKGWKS